MTDRPINVLALIEPRFDNPATYDSTILYRVIHPFADLEKRGFSLRLSPSVDIAKDDYRWADVLLYKGVALTTAAGAELQRILCHNIGKRLVLDLDDNRFEIEPHNPAYAIAVEESPSIMATARVADLVTVSTENLRKVVRRYCSRVRIIPNTMNPSEWASEADRAHLRRPSGLTVGLRGGNSHTEDWRILAELFPVLATKYPDLTFVVAGHMPDYIARLDLGDRMVILPWVPRRYFPAVMAQIDINLAPLPNSRFNRCKSPIAWMEAAMCGTPTVASPTVYGDVIRNGRTGLIAHSLTGWIDGVSQLVEQPDLRRQIGEAARVDVLRRFTSAAIAPTVEAAYREIFAPGHAVHRVKSFSEHSAHSANPEKGAQL